MTESNVQEALRERYRCYGCYRSLDACFCSEIPSIENQTSVLILQHMRERTHPFNTARILHRALSNSRMLIDHNDRLAEQLERMQWSPRVGLLYPGDEAVLIDDLQESQKPEQLVIIDGTWHHTKTMLRDIPLLRKLPRYRLTPTEPSRYGIRREPHALYLSTLEAAVASLRSLEPETAGFDQLLQAFELMVRRQQAHPKAEYGWRKNLHHGNKPLRVPDVLRDGLENIVAVYAETTSGAFESEEQGRAGKQQDSLRKPLYWVAQRLVSSECFECPIASDEPVTDTLLTHLELSASTFEHAQGWESFQEAWKDFIRPTDTIVIYHSHVRSLLSQLRDFRNETLYLRSIQFNKQSKNGTLDQVTEALGLHSGQVLCQGRAGKRLAQTISLVEYLHTLQ
jgi:DTW domain-containing protein